MNKKLLTVLLVAALLVTAVVSGTMAYFTDSESAVNVMTLGNVDIELNEEQRGENGDEDFEDNKPLYPVVPAPSAPPSDWENYVDKIVTVTNTGDSDAYVRVQIAVPASLDDNGALIVDTVNDDWEIVDTGLTMVKDGITYNIYDYTYKTILEVGKPTTSAIYGVYLDPKVDYDPATGKYYITDGVDKVVLEGMYADVNGHNKIEVLVYAQAVQAEGFKDAEQAFEAANFPVPGAPEAIVEKADELTIQGHMYDLTVGTSSWKGCNNPVEFTLDTAYVFTAPDTAETVATNPYRYWNADYVVTVDQDLPADVATLAGQYGSFDEHWLIIPVNFEVKAGEEYRLLQGTSGITMTYAELCDAVKVFQCGAEASDAAEGVTLTVELRLFETINADTDSGNHVDETGRSISIGTYSYTF